ncbi:hypothetical protein BEL04_09075 [Mucilaginibacter sp. PPCGB 2223]|uniref:response regulator n=1 Tax=Mucilaginibacter sp. PPCGB 2223 TaxID=1886027 RepID=UPI0008262F9D|nr:response regulator [Mucilaginibacter sp. PPCGB 2223]OCX54392.1 hypothetical protein BEL04_09075 [Mucilaginibacter sp. PPCGB 2223]
MKTTNPQQVQVFLIDGDESHRNSYLHSLNAGGISSCRGFASVEDGISGLTNGQPDVIVLAYGMLTSNGTDVLQRIRDLDPFIDVVLLPGPSYANAMEKLTQLSGYNYRRRENTDYILDYLLTILSRASRSKRSA